MKNQNSSFTNLTLKKRFFILLQFFLIIFVYHTLKDLKDTIVITGSKAGAEIIPFIKIWGILPVTIGASYLFSKLYNRLGREKTVYFFVTALLSIYMLFACVLYPFREVLHLTVLSHYLTGLLPAGCLGFISMICYWHYTLFYIAAELWSLLILTILFWGYLNETTTLETAKKFYPICMFTGNFAGIFSGQCSYFLCHTLRGYFSWEITLQLIIGIVAVAACSIMGINRWLSARHQIVREAKSKDEPSISFRASLLSIFRSFPLFCIASLVVGFALTSNLIEVIWKDTIRQLHPTPQAYNAYINQLTTWIGVGAVVMAFFSRWIFQKMSWTQVALLTPFALLCTSLLFFSARMLPAEYVSFFSGFVRMTPLHLMVTLGAIHYVLGLIAKYTIFDTTKEMAFFSIPVEERMRAKSVIDSIGSRLGKSGASCIYQFFLIVGGAASGHLSMIFFFAIASIGFSVFTTKKLGNYLFEKTEKNLSFD